MDGTRTVDENGMAVFSGGIALVLGKIINRVFFMEFSHKLVSCNFCSYGCRGD